MGCAEPAQRDECTHEGLKDVATMKRHDYPVAEPEIGEEELQNVVEAVRSSWISGKGRFVDRFEDSFAKYIGVECGAAASSGTAALHLALAALDIGPGDEVIVPDLTFAATINAVMYTGARPTLVDVNPEYWCIDIAKIEEAITPRTKAIIPVHLYGHPCDLDGVMEIAQRRGLYVIEDCAEAHGAEYRGKKAGSRGHVACYSFYANKVITTGEGGMCLTNDGRLSKKIRILRDHGMSPERRYWHETVGFSYHMTNLQAAIGLAQLEKVERFIEKRRQMAKLYAEELSHVDGITLHPEMSWAKCIYWLYSILVDETEVKVSRDLLAERLREKRIDTRNLFYPLHEMPLYQKYGVSAYPASSRISNRGISLPSSTKLGEEDVVFIAQRVRKSLETIW